MTHLDLVNDIHFEDPLGYILFDHQVNLIRTTVLALPFENAKKRIARNRSNDVARKRPRSVRLRRSVKWNG